ncbi:MAG: PAS-domain containing protein [Alphaproteobacteria bacterium]|nr:PAS-domain containing protein [Alphaproteobacteria bacterium]
MDVNGLTILCYLSVVTCAVLAVAVINFKIKLLRQKQKNYFLKRDRQRYAETIFASKDGYFAFIYPDTAIKDPLKTTKERCSRRLAVMLDLKNGIQSSFEDVLSVFYKEDAERLKKYLALMQEEGVTFEDTFTLKTTKRGIRVFASRINALDGNLYCDMLWFRDLSAEQIKIEDMEEQCRQKDTYIKMLEDLIDHLPTPVYLKDQHRKLTVVNKKYAEFLGVTSKKELLKEHEKSEWEKASDKLSKLASETNQPQKKNVQIVLGGTAHYFEMKETPFHNEEKLDKIGISGQLIDMTELSEVKRHFKVHQNAHLEVLSALGTAFAIFDSKAELVFYNKSFVDMWGLTPEDLEQKFSFSSFLDMIRNKRLLPDISDFKEYKKNQLELFSNLLEAKENLLHLPDDRTLRRLVSPHPNGLIFAYEDVSDKLAAERTIHELENVQKSILDNISEATLIFEQDGRLKYFNTAYLRLFKSDIKMLQNLPNIMEVFEMQQFFFKKVENWNNLKQHMFHHIFEICAPFKLELDDASIIDVKPLILPDETIMVIYNQ